jgi:hypothetical protein
MRIDFFFFLEILKGGGHSGYIDVDGNNIKMYYNFRGVDWIYLARGRGV